MWMTDTCHSRGYTAVPYFILICISLMTCDVDNLFMWLYVIRVSSLVKYLFKSSIFKNSVDRHHCWWYDTKHIPFKIRNEVNSPTLTGSSQPCIGRARQAHTWILDMWQKQMWGKDRPFKKGCEMISNPFGRQRTRVAASYTLYTKIKPR